MPFITGEDAKTVRDILAQLPRKVKLVYFTQELECQYCNETLRLLEEIKELGNGNIELEISNFLSEKYKIDKIPATIVMNNEKDYGIRLYGIPSGYEFSTLLEDIQMVAKANLRLQKKPKLILLK